MSWPALAWASKQRPGRAPDKLVLIALADRHNEESGLAYPSIAWLCEFSDLNRKTVIASLQRLEALGLIADSGQRVGKSRQIKAYALHLETVPKAEQSRKRNSPVFSARQSQKRDTEPFLEPIPVSNETVDSPLDDFSCDDFQESWNAVAAECGLPVIRKLTKQRRRAFQVRKREYPDISDWQTAFRYLRSTKWMHGDNPRGWRANPDFFLQSSSFTKLVEGSYAQAD